MNRSARRLLHGAFVVVMLTTLDSQASETTSASTAVTNSLADADPPGFKSRAAMGLEKPAEEPGERWNWHVQSTVILQGDPGFPAKYSGPNSLNPAGELRETVSQDLFVGLRLWRGAEVHADELVWQGFGLSDAHGIEAFPNGEAFKVGTEVPNINLARLFVRQTIGLGGETDKIEDDDLHLTSWQDASRLTLTVGRFSTKDVFDNNAYANDPRTQFMNWALMANEAWDYPSDPLGYTTGLAAEINVPKWALRYGFFQEQRVSGGAALDSHFLKAWGMVTEVERRYTVHGHPGAVRVLGYLNRAHMGSYQASLENAIRLADIEATRAYRYKYGFGLNVEQELTKSVGIFARVGWSDGRTEAWTFGDVDRTATAGVSIRGGAWHRPNDTWGLAGALNGISRAHQEFFTAGGTGILGGDGALAYGAEKALETYYDCQVWKRVHAALDYQFIADPAYNRNRGPVHIVGVRVHADF